ncbi:MAG: fibronectin type III domain-containing protein [Patescibacteria group bacterium]|jgi:hypothetical protein
MVIKILKINLLIIGIFLVVLGFVPHIASAKNINVNVSVYICNNDGVCDADQGEDYLTCLADCPAPICNNNGTCESGSGENESNCPADCPTVIPTTTTSTSGGSIFLPTDHKPPLINQISVFSISRTNANISWITDELAYCQLDWGESSEYSGGSIAEISFFTNHSTEIPNLNPGTNYYFQISCYDRSHNLGRVTNEWFTTLPLNLVPFPTPPEKGAAITPEYPIPSGGKPTVSGESSSSIGTTTATTSSGEVAVPEQPSSTYPIWESWSTDVLESVYRQWLIVALGLGLIWWLVFWKRGRKKENKKEDKEK